MTFPRCECISGADAEQSARELDAYAYTAGRHIVFGTGRFDPASREGRRLLAHELTHVVQQNASDVTSSLIQRAKISYRQLKWSDFLAQAPQNALEAAGIWSAFELPSFSVVVETKDTKEKCRNGKIRSTRFKASITLDPAQADKLDAFMDTDQSWLQDRFKDDGTIFCNDRVKECEKVSTTMPRRSERAAREPCPIANRVSEKPKASASTRSTGKMFTSKTNSSAGRFSSTIARKI